MVPVKKLINDPDALINDLVAGMISAHPRHLTLMGGTGRAIVARHGPRRGKVGIVIGGGSGHEPAFACYVGQGLADAAAVGNIFASPSPAHIVDAAMAVERGAGVVFLYGNYAGDVMNFDMAADELAKSGIVARSFLVTDDIASAPPERASERRGIAGDFFVFKVAGAAADLGHSLEEVMAAAARANENTRTMGVALAPCSMPQTGKANFDIPDGQMEVGMGIHGEPGVERSPIGTADAVSDRLLAPILEELACAAGDRVVVLVNGLGSTTLMEQYLVHRRVAEVLETKKIKIHHSWVGEYCTSLEMAGVSITLMKLDEDLTTWLDHPCDTPALQVGESEGFAKAEAPNPVAPTKAPKAARAKQDISQLANNGDVSPADMRQALLGVAEEMSAQRDTLCKLDGAIGDGDHGITMDIGWRAVADRLGADASGSQTISEMFGLAADAFLNAVGASVGPLYASAFQSAAHALEDRLNLDPTATSRWIEAMAEGIEARGKAQVGEKTMVDAWRPAADAARSAAGSARSSSAVLQAAADAAKAGALATKDMVGAKGRSRTLGERARGHADPGAASSAMILSVLASTL